MRFSQLIKFNSVPDWRDHYIDYSAIKKIIYAIAKREAQEGRHDPRQSLEVDSDEEQGVNQPLLTPRDGAHKKSKEHDTDEDLLAIMYNELARINQVRSKLTLPCNSSRLYDDLPDAILYML